MRHILISSASAGITSSSTYQEWILRRNIKSLWKHLYLLDS